MRPLRPALYSISLTFKWQFTAVLLVRPMAVAGRILWNRVCPSFPPDVCVGVLLKLDHYISLNFGMVPEILKKLCITTRFHRKTFFVPKIGKMGQKLPKLGFFEFKEKFKTIYSVMKTFICCVHAKILWEKSCSWDIGQILSANQTTGFLNELFLLSKLMKQSHF